MPIFMYAKALLDRIGAPASPTCYPGITSWASIVFAEHAYLLRVTWSSGGKSVDVYAGTAGFSRDFTEASGLAGKNATDKKRGHFLQINERRMTPKAGEQQSIQRGESEMKNILWKRICRIPKIPFIALLSMLLTGAGSASASEYKFPAEWEQQSAVWQAWYEYPTIPGMHDVTAQIIEVLQNVAHVKVELIVKPQEKSQAISFLQGYNVNINAISFREYENLYIFTRDLGPAFVKNSAGQGKVQNFAWNFYGVGNNVYEKLAIGYLDRDMAQKLNLPTIDSDIVAEGGGYEVNGAGVMMAFKDMALHRNPGKTIQEIEQEILRVYGYQKMIWIDRSPVSDTLVVGTPVVENYFTYGANGHVDEAVRFVSANTILVGQISQEARNSNALEALDYEILEEAAATLAAATDINGQPFNIIRVPMPNLEDHWYERLIVPGDDAYDFYKGLGYDDGDTVTEVPAVSYLNFLITNNVVISAKYWQPGMPQRVKDLDRQSKEILQARFPGRQVVQINPTAINWMGGGMHCITQQQPVLAQ